MRSNKEMIAEIKKDIKRAEIAAEMNANASVQNAGHGRKTVKVFVLAAALLAVLSLSVFAAYKLMIPKQISDDLGVDFENVRTVVEDGKADAETVKVVHKSAESGDYVITFEALADSSALRNVFEGTADHKKLELSKKDTFALFTVRRADGAPAGLTFEDLNYTVCLKGYAPNIAFSKGKAFYAENGVVWFAAQVTDAKVFGGDELYIAVHECNTADWEYFRMDENGEFYFTDRYEGIKAIFELPLENDGTDSRTKEQFMADRNVFISDPDYSWYDEKAAKDDAFKSSCVDLTPYIGSHEWLGSYPLQFGKVAMAEEYIEHRNDWMNGGLRLLTYEEAENIANAAAALLAESCDLEKICAEDEKQFEKLVETAEFKEEFFPSDASFFTLSDGSKAYYLPCGSFIHLKKDNTASLVCAPCANVIVECDGINPILNAINAYTGYCGALIGSNGTGHSVTSLVTVAGRYLDGLGLDEAYPTYAGGNIDDFKIGYDDNLKLITGREDAVYLIASEFCGYTGTIEVIA